MNIKEALEHEKAFHAMKIQILESLAELKIPDEDDVSIHCESTHCFYVWAYSKEVARILVSWLGTSKKESDSATIDFVGQRFGMRIKVVLPKGPMTGCTKVIETVEIPATPARVEKHIKWVCPEFIFEEKVQRESENESEDSK